MKKNLVVILGSGASFDSGYKVNIGEKAINPPMDINFFQEMSDDLLKEEYYAIWKFRKLYFPGEQNYRMEDVWTAVDLNHKNIRLGTYNWAIENGEYQTGEYFTFGRKYPEMDMVSPITYLPNSGRGILHSPSYNEYKFLGDCGRDFRRLIYDIYSSYIPPDEGLDNLKLLHSKLRSSDQCKLLAYITFNYDCYLEHALNPNFKYVTTNDNPEEIILLLHGEIPIIKLHGSLSWQESRNPHRIIYNAPPFEKSRQIEPAYYNDGQWLQPAIIPPTVFKQEINDDARTGDILTQAILQQWRAAIRLLLEADKVIIIGYSFPASDYHSKRIFHIARMRRMMGEKPPFEIFHCGGGKDKTDKILEIFGKESMPKIRNKFSDLYDSKELEDFLNL